MKTHCLSSYMESSIQYNDSIHNLSWLHFSASNSLSMTQTTSVRKTENVLYECIIHKGYSRHCLKWSSLTARNNIKILRHTQSFFLLCHQEDPFSWRHRQILQSHFTWNNPPTPSFEDQCKSSWLYGPSEEENWRINCPASVLRRQLQSFMVKMPVNLLHLHVDKYKASCTHQITSDTGRLL